MNYAKIQLLIKSLKIENEKIKTSMMMSWVDKKLNLI